MWTAARSLILLLFPLVCFGQLSPQQRAIFMATSVPKNASASTSPLQNITTAATTTPSVTNITLAGTQNAVRVFTGELFLTNGGFNLYVSKNGGSVYTVRLYRWQGRILQGAAGDSFAFGTDAGAVLQMCAMTTPGTLITPSGATGTALCDKAGPPIWVPANDHITLPAENSAFQVDTASIEIPVFVSEYDGTTWSQPHWFWTQTNAPVRVQCTYKHIALANYDGATLAITAPTSSTIGGTSNCMTLGLPAVTGTTRTCSTIQDFTNAIAAAVSGDAIVLNAGQYQMPYNITEASFAANHNVGGKKGMEGITIRGATLANSNLVWVSGANWFINNSTASGTSYLSSITFTDTNITGANFFHIGGGHWTFESVRFTGPGSTTGGELIQSDGAGASITSDFLFCSADNAAEDCFGENGNATFNASSKIRYIACRALVAGAAAASQCVTTHNGNVNYIYGGYLSDAPNNIIANGAIGDVSYVNFMTADGGARKCGMSNIKLLGCMVWDQGVQSILPETNGYVLFSRFVGTNWGSTYDMFINPSASVSHNRLRANSGRAIHNSKFWCQAYGNIVEGFADAIRDGDYTTGAISNYWLIGNTVVGTTTAFDILETGGPITLFTNNITKTSGTSINCTTTSRNSLTNDYNVLDPTVDVDYVAGANDITGADAAIDSNYLPTAAGNCDGNGLANVLGWVGDSDPYGFVWIYLPTRMSRGAREIPAIYANALVFPDLY